MTDYSLLGVIRVTWPVFCYVPIICLESVKLRASNFVCWLMHWST